MTTLSRKAIDLHEKIRATIHDFYWLNEISPAATIEILESIAKDCNERAEFIRDNGYSKVSYQMLGVTK